MPIDFARVSPADEMFSWTVPGDDAEVVHIAVTRLLRYLAASNHPIGEFPLVRELALTVFRQNGIEPVHLSRITAERLEDPILQCAWGDGTHVIADGSHRLIERARRGLRTYRAFDVQPHVWRRFTVCNMPQDDAAWRAALKDWNS